MRKCTWSERTECHCNDGKAGKNELVNHGGCLLPIDRLTYKRDRRTDFSLASRSDSSRRTCLRGILPGRAKTAGITAMSQAEKRWLVCPKGDTPHPFTPVGMRYRDSDNNVTMNRPNWEDVAHRQLTLSMVAFSAVRRLDAFDRAEPFEFPKAIAAGRGSETQTSATHAVALWDWVDIRTSRIERRAG